MKEQKIIWYSPEEKLPREDESVLVTISGQSHGGNIHYDHALYLATYDEFGWDFGEEFDERSANFEVIAWADVHAYGTKVCAKCGEIYTDEDISELSRIEPFSLDPFICPDCYDNLNRKDLEDQFNDLMKGE